MLAAEAGMPQLDPTYWASQAFWLVLIFTALYLALSNLFIRINKFDKAKYKAVKIKTNQKA